MADRRRRAGRRRRRRGRGTGSPGLRPRRIRRDPCPRSDTAVDVALGGELVVRRRDGDPGDPEGAGQSPDTRQQGARSDTPIADRGAQLVLDLAIQRHVARAVEHDRCGGRHGPGIPCDGPARAGSDRSSRRPAVPVEALRRFRPVRLSTVPRPSGGPIPADDEWPGWSHPIVARCALWRVQPGPNVRAGGCRTPLLPRAVVGRDPASRGPPLPLPGRRMSPLASRSVPAVEPLARSVRASAREGGGGDPRSGLGASGPWMARWETDGRITDAPTSADAARDGRDRHRRLQHGDHAESEHRSEWDRERRAIERRRLAIGGPLAEPAGLRVGPVRLHLHAERRGRPAATSSSPTGRPPIS